MKKSLLALAVLGAFAGVAQAQTSVTIYGSFDAGVRYLKGVDAANHSRTTMGSTGVYNSNRLGFRGVEDLGGGLNAHFNLEQGFNSGTGQLNFDGTGALFNRTASVGLGGAWGAVDLGRQYSVNFRTIGVYDPFNYKFTTIIPLANQGGLTRLNNDIQYTGTFGPVTARAEYALGEQVGNGRNGSTAAGGVTYAAGPFSAGAAYTFRKNNVNPLAVAPAAGTLGLPPGAPAIAGAAANFQNQRNWTVGGAFATGPARIAVGYADSKQDTGAGADLRIKDIWLGGSYNLTPAMALTAAWYQTRLDAAGFNGRRNLPIIGATYALSKRTNFYFDVDHARYTGAGRVLVANSLPSSATPTQGASAAGRDRQTGVSVGINHLF
jgi:predicted porin